MPLALAPSNVLPTMDDPPPLSTEASSAYVDPSVSAAAVPRPYRGALSVEPAGVVATPALLTQLEALGARLEALKPPAPAEEPAPAPVVDEAAPWEAQCFDSFAKYSGEATKVRATGRLPFGSDNKKMAL